MEKLQLYRCRRCGMGFDYDFGEPKKTCDVCGGGLWEANRGTVNPVDVYRIKEETGIWAVNTPPETDLDEAIGLIGSLEDGPHKDECEAKLGARLKEEFGEAQWLEEGTGS